ncbi:cysteine-rich CWC family protein [Pedobacter sp. P351]|uniref:cysteine-rich CWC family protein n=1 Tax=Pedobacter superstes TaxID=3133441 RepID=UPI003098FCCD
MAGTYLISRIQLTKHEIIPCERCGNRIECKANSYTKCQCSKVQLSLNETQYICENYDGCLCADCLLDLQKEYLKMINTVDINTNPSISKL